MVGAVEFAVAVTNAAAVLGYAVTVVDPRPVFLTDERFPAADQRVVGWPTRVLAETPVDASTVVVVLSHDDRFDAAVIDPPRAGAPAQAEHLAASRVPVVAWVSCDPVTFARDARRMVLGGYRLSALEVVDQFRWSPHVETVAAFHRQRTPG